MTTQKQIQMAVLDVVAAMLECIESAGENGLPSGHLYATVMGAMRLETYDKIIGILKNAGRITERHNVLYAVKKQ